MVYGGGIRIQCRCRFAGAWLMHWAEREPMAMSVRASVKEVIAVSGRCSLVNDASVDLIHKVFCDGSRYVTEMRGAANMNADTIAGDPGVLAGLFMLLGILLEEGCCATRTTMIVTTDNAGVNSPICGRCDSRWWRFQIENSFGVERK